MIAPDLSGGGVTRVYLVASIIQAAGYAVEVTGFAFGAKVYPDPPAHLVVRPVFYDQARSPLPQIQTLLRQITGDVVYAIKPKPTSYGIALLKQVFARCPVAVDIDDWELSWLGGDDYRYRPGLRQFLRDLLKPDGSLRKADHPLYIQWMEGLVKRATAISINTRFLQQRFGGTYLPNCKDTQLFDPHQFDPHTSREKYGLAPYRVLMFPGTARPHKGLEDILIAMDQLNWDNLRLVIVGGRKPDNYEDQLIEQWGRWIIKIPPQAPETMPEVVAAADVVVVPQRDSPIAQAQFPIKLTDGMAMAKPILATRVGDIPEILGDAGYLVEPGSPPQLAAALEQIFADFDAAIQIGKAARVRCENYYSVATAATILAAMMEQSVLSAI